MKADAEWDAVTAKVQGKDVAYESLDVTCHIATVPDDSSLLALLSDLSAQLDASAKLPVDTAAGQQHARLVIGSLDLNVGHTLPAEELIGKMPQADPRHTRAYISNVCVAPAARRFGVAYAMMQYVEKLARSKGVQYLYVHVVADNLAAVELYQGRCAFEVEARESEGFARSLQRPRRMLLVKKL